MHRRWPNLFLVGAPKCGTTSLHEALARHPDAFMSPVKEPHHFATDLRFSHPRRNPYGTADAYLGLFEQATSQRILGESSVWYLFSSVAGQRIAERQPEARVLCVLRNPVELVCSLHGFACRGGGEPLLRLRDALAAEGSRARGVGVPRSSHAPWSLQYRAVADYGPQLSRFLQRFSREQVGVFLYEDLRDDPAGTFRSICQFAGMEPDPSIEVGRANVTANHPPRSYSRWLRSFPRATAAGLRAVPTPVRRAARYVLSRVVAPPVAAARVEPEDIVELQRWFAPRIRALESMLGRSLDRWTADPEALATRRNEGRA